MSTNLRIYFTQKYLYISLKNLMIFGLKDGGLYGRYKSINIRMYSIREHLLHLFRYLLYTDNNRLEYGPLVKDKRMLHIDIAILLNYTYSSNETNHTDPTLHVL